MGVTPSRFVPTSKSTYILTIADYKKKRLSGVIYCPLLEKTYAFDNLMQFLLLMESLMDEASFPQRGVEQRAFQVSAVTTLARSPAEKPLASRLATFTVNVLFRQNASWQGSIVWNERKLESHFRSVLELITLLDDALCAAQGN